jgi:flagellar hook-length control protein FliK
MMTQGVMTQAMNLLGGSQGSTAAKNKKTGSDFGLFMESSVSTGKNTANLNEADSTASNTATAKDTRYEKRSMTESSVRKGDTSKEDNRSEKINSTSESQETPITKSKEVMNSTSEKASETDNTKDASENEQLASEILGMLQQVRDMLMEILQISPEELDQLIEKYQAMNAEFSPVDLLQPDTLSQLVLVNSGKTDPLSVLTDEKLANNMKQLLEAMQQIKSDVGLPISLEQMKAILEEVKAAMDFNLQDSLQTQDSSLQNESLTNQMVSAENTEQLETETSYQEDASSDLPKIIVSHENSAGSQTDTRGDRNQNSDTLDQYQAFVEKLVQVTQTTQTDLSGNAFQVTEIRDITNQIVEHIKISIKPESTSMEMQLNPENLGKVNLTIQSKSGVMTAHFVVQNELSKEAIESQINTLRETLNQQGIKVEQIEVAVSAYAFGQNEQSDQSNQPEDNKNQSGRKISLEEAFAMSELPVEESSLQEDGLRGSQIDYTA